MSSALIIMDNFSPVFHSIIVNEVTLKKDILGHFLAGHYAILFHP